jgi:hypothetical protein
LLGLIPEGMPIGINPPLIYHTLEAHFTKGTALSHILISILLLVTLGCNSPLSSSLKQAKVSERESELLASRSKTSTSAKNEKTIPTKEKEQDKTAALLTPTSSHENHFNKPLNNKTLPYTDNFQGRFLMKNYQKLEPKHSRV